MKKLHGYPIIPSTKQFKKQKRCYAHLFLFSHNIKKDYEINHSLLLILIDFNYFFGIKPLLIKNSVATALGLLHFDST